jgi:hypothetical protein
LAPDVASPFLPKNDEEGTGAADKPADAPKVVPNIDGIQLRTINVPMPAGRYSKIIAAGNRLFALDRTAGPLGNGGPTQLIAFDIDKDGHPVIIPARALATTFSSPYSVGLQKVTGSFESVLDAPKDGYRPDTSTTIAVGQPL